MVSSMCKRSVPLFGKEGLGEILLDKSPFFKGGGGHLPSSQMIQNIGISACNRRQK